MEDETDRVANSKTSLAKIQGKFPPYVDARREFKPKFKFEGRSCQKLLLLHALHILFEALHVVFVFRFFLSGGILRFSEDRFVAGRAASNAQSGCEND